VTLSFADIDWSIHDKYPEDTCECRGCGKTFRSHAKAIVGAGLVSRKPCPSCGGHAMRSARSDPETFSW
jgi:rRNA maturation endonuclease Nob1